jgi:hypothetical protein
MVLYICYNIAHRTDGKNMSNRDVPDKQGRTGAQKGGRPLNSKSARSLRQNKFKQVLDRIDPLLAKALKKAEAILDAPLEDNKGVSATTQLQAAKLVIDKCLELREVVYGKEPDQIEDPADDEPEDKAPQQARFVTNVIPMKPE